MQPKHPYYRLIFVTDNNVYEYKCGRTYLTPKKVIRYILSIHDELVKMVTCGTKFKVMVEYVEGGKPIKEWVYEITPVECKYTIRRL